MFTDNLLTGSNSQYHTFDLYQIKKLKINDLPSVIQSDYQQLTDSEKNSLLHALCYNNINLVSDYIQQSETHDSGQLPVQKANIFNETPLQIIMSQFKKHPEPASQAFNTIFKHYHDLNLGNNFVSLELEQELDFESNQLSQSKKILSFANYLAQNFYYLNYEQKQNVLNGIEQNNSHYSSNQSLINDCFFEVTDFEQMSYNFISNIKPKSVIDNIKLFKQYTIDTDLLDQNGRDFFLSFLRIKKARKTLNQVEQLDFIQQFIDELIDINRINKNDETFLEQAIDEEQDDLIQLLIDNGADVNICNKQGYNALLTSCTHYPKAVNWILPYTNNVNAVNNCQNNALFLLINNYLITKYDEQFQSNVVYSMLLKGADPYHRNNKNVNVFDILDARSVKNKQAIAQVIYNFEKYKQLKQQIKTSHHSKKKSINKLL